MGKLSYYLDQRKKNPSVKMLLSYKRKSCLFSMSVVLNSVDQWTGTADNPIVSHSLAHQYNQILRARMALATDKMYTLELERGESLTFDELRSAILEALNPNAATELQVRKKIEEQKVVGVLGHYSKVMAEYNGRTWEIYETTLRRIREYAEDTHGRADAEDYENISRGGLPSESAQRYLMGLRFEDITEEWLDGWRDSMSDTKGDATQSIYLRTFRHVCKDAFDRDLTTSYVWKRYKIPKADGEVHPLTEEEFHTLFAPDVPDWAEPHRQLAWFGFCTIGMNVVDMHKLEWQQIREGYMRYVRSKTGRKYCIRLEPEALEVVNSLKNDNSEPKVFRWATAYKRHGDYTQHLNHALKQMGVEDMHYYRLRHTWATFAARIGISMDDIARSLGHGKKTVTDVYVEVDQSRIDEANRKVIDYALNIINK